MIRERHIKSGRLLEVDFYPVYPNGRRMSERAPKSEVSTEEQQEYNKNQSTRRLIRLVNANFDNEDVFLHLTFSPENVPQSEEKMRQLVNNYFNRIRYYRKKHNLVEMKYILVPEKKVYRTGPYAGLVNWHCHIFITGQDMTRDQLEDMWKLGTANANRYQPDTFGPETAAKYLAKDPQGKKRFIPSKNLTKPFRPKPKDGRIGRKTVERMAKIHRDDRAYWERRYKGYDFIDCFPRFNEFNSHWYVSVVMFKRQKQKKRKE